MKKIIFLLFFTIFLFNFLFAQQKDTMIMVIAKEPKEYLKTASNFSSTLQKALNTVIQTTPKYFFLDNAGIKSEFIKCYFDTSVIKTIADSDSAILMIKEKYVKHQGDFLKLNKKPFVNIVGNDVEGIPFEMHSFLGKTTVVGVNNSYIGMFFEPMYKDLDSIKQTFSNVNVAMLTEAMSFEVNQAMRGKKYNFPIIPNCKEVLKANISNNFQLPYYVILDKNGSIKDMLFMYDSSGLYSFGGSYNCYNLKVLQKMQVEFSYFSELKKILSDR